MVFSVQQGEHGPLVVYKLEIPANTAAAPPVRDTGRLAEPLSVIPSRAPRVLGRISATPELPGTPATPAPGPAGGVSVLDVLEALTPAAAPRQAERFLEWEADGEGVTLDRVNADISWRRETADRLRRLPFSPSF